MNKDYTEQFLPGVVEKYNEKLLEGRVAIEGNLVACFFKDLLLIEDNELNIRDFKTKDGRFLFNLACSLRDKGFNVTEELAILSSFDEKIIERYNEIGGWDTISNMMEVINLDNFDSYLEAYTKSNLLMSLWLKNYGVFTDVTIKDKTVERFDLFKKMTTSEIVDYYIADLSTMQVGEGSEILEEGNLTMSQEWIDLKPEEVTNWVSYADAGLDINGDRIDLFPKLSDRTLGYQRGTFNIIAGFGGLGKSTFANEIAYGLWSKGEKVLIISNELSKEEFWEKLVILTLTKYGRYYGTTKRKFFLRENTEEEKQLIKDICLEHYKKEFAENLYFVKIASMNTNLVKKKIREYHLRYGISAVFVDTLKLEISSYKEARQDLNLAQTTAELDMLSKKYGLIVVATAQLANAMENRLFLNADCFAQSKSIKDLCHSVLMMRKLHREEMDAKNRWYIQPFRYELIQRLDEESKKTIDYWIEREYELDPHKEYRVVFVEKNRSGKDNGDGMALILRFDGDWQTFTEVCWCKPKHGVIQ